jgi:SAM-dependent methyltransferase
MSGALYDRIGIGYATHRRPDPRIASYVDAALEDAASVVNVGAGTGSYEPANRRVVAVEPSRTMIRQRRTLATPVVQGSAANLPFDDGSFDAALAILTIHHWPDWRAGLLEMRRVSRSRVVLFTHAASPEPFWLTRDYFPEITSMDEGRMPTPDEIGDVLGPCSVTAVPVPHDCSDGFLGAYWRRPELYLDAGVRGAISGFAQMADARPGLHRLEADLRSGTWRLRNEDILTRERLDIGYRLVVAAV